MANFVSKSGITKISVGASPSRSGTPLLEVQNLIQGNTVRVTVNFAARTEQAGRANGFYYEISAIDSGQVTALTPTSLLFQGSDSWQSCTLSAYFRVQGGVDPNAPTEDIDFEVLFSKGDISGQGSILNFLLHAEVVSNSADY